MHARSRHRRLPVSFPAKMKQNHAELRRTRGRAKGWIAETLIPWCRQAARSDLLKAEAEWLDIAGRVPVEASLWTWAWGRFPALVTEGLPGLDEAHAVVITTTAGETVTGYPDARESGRGRLVLIDGDGRSAPPISIDDVHSVTRV